MDEVAWRICLSAIAQTLLKISCLVILLGGTKFWVQRWVQNSDFY
jgi:TRAP-type C4-dicarboxylate transport system permease small subunit